MENSCSVHKEHPHSEDFCLPVQGLGCVEFTTLNVVESGVAIAKFTTPYDKCSQTAKSRWHQDSFLTVKYRAADLFWCRFCEMIVHYSD